MGAYEQRSFFATRFENQVTNALSLGVFQDFHFICYDIFLNTLTL